MSIARRIIDPIRFDPESGQRLGLEQRDHLFVGFWRGTFSQNRTLGFGRRRGFLTLLSDLSLRLFRVRVQWPSAERIAGNAVFASQRLLTSEKKPSELGKTDSAQQCRGITRTNSIDAFHRPTHPSGARAHVIGFRDFSVSENFLLEQPQSAVPPCSDWHGSAPLGGGGHVQQSKSQAPGLQTCSDIWPRALATDDCV